MMLTPDQQQDELEIELIRVIGPAMDRGVAFENIKRALVGMIVIVKAAEGRTAMGDAGMAMLDKAVHESRKGMH